MLQCYYIIVKEVLLVSTVMTKSNLLKFLISYHKEKYETEITPIKLQKSFYFLFAYYIKFFKSDETKDFDKIYGEIPDKLFESNFEAWDYGPVDPDIYSQYKYDMTITEKNIHVANVMSVNNPLIEEFILNYTEQIFNSGDFGLVELSHRDLCWSNNYKEGLKGIQIPEEDIIREYSNNIL